jgi:hypothetical protein
MITPQQEAVSLKDEPLPVIITPDDEWLPSSIYQIDQDIAHLQDQIRELQATRSELLGRAVETGILEDSFCVIREKVKTFRKLDIAQFRANEPEKYKRACEFLRVEIEDQLKHVGENIPLKMVDMLVKKNRQYPFITTTETRLYAVERREKEVE